MFTKVSPSTASSLFNEGNGVLIVKKMTGKVYVKLPSEKSYSKTEDGKLVFSSSDNAVSYVQNLREFTEDGRKLKLSFVARELADFDFYTIEDETNFSEIFFNFARLNQHGRPTSTKVTETVTPPMPKPTIASNVNVNIHITKEASNSASTRARMFRNLLNS